MEVVYRPEDDRVVQSRWPTWLVLGHTFAGSVRVVAEAWAGRLDQGAVDAHIQRWCGQVFGVSRTTLVAAGRARLGPGPYVLLSNHTSLLDIPAVCAAFPGRVRFVAKQELRKVPGFGAAMERAGVVFVDRSDRARAIHQLDAAKTLLREGTSVWIAAEGARSRDGRLHPLKKGGFHLARSLGVPMVPVWIQGAWDVLPPDQLRSTTGQTVTVVFGAPLPAPGEGREGLRASMVDARAALLALAKEAGAPEDVDAA